MEQRPAASPSRPERFHYLDKNTLPFPFCPGCGHGQILPRIDEALQQIGADPAKVVIVTDIGCVGLSDQYFKTHAFHGLHGRSVTYATGIKLARPDFHVIVLMGDGGMGIGGAHLLSAARRNIGITVLVFNNGNFGMTGGQHSVTTPEGAKTATTTLGNLETPLDICATLAPSRPNFLARSHGYDTALPRLIVEGLNCQGFALIDIQEYCTAYFVPGNLHEESGLLSLPTGEEGLQGIVGRNHRPEFSRAYRDRYHRAAEVRVEESRGLDVLYSHRLTKRTGILLAGAAGQKIRSTATLLGKAAIASGLYVTQKDDYPITIMTGYSVSEILLSPDPIEYTGIDVPDLLIVLSEEGLKKVKQVIPTLRAGSSILTEETLTIPKTEARIVPLPWKQIAQKIDPSIAALVAVGSLLAKTGIFPPAAIAWAIQSSGRGERAVMGLQAFEAGLSLL